MKRIVFVLPSFAGGGAERVALTLAGALERARFAPEIVVLDGAGPLEAAVAPGLPVHDLHRRRLRGALPALARILRGLGPAVVVSTLGHVNLALLALRPWLAAGTRIVVREANTPSMSLAAQPWPRLFRTGTRLLYPRADAILCPSHLIAEELARDFAVPKARLHLIPNPVDVDAIRAAAAPPRREPGAGARFVASGRLTHQKGFDRLIEAMAAMPEDARLAILGTGPRAADLRARAAARGVEGRVALPGFAADPWSLYAGADAFLLPSRWEGMANAALEALACGTPVIATPEAGGIAEVAGDAPPGAVTLAAAGRPFAEAMAGVRAGPPSAPRPSLLPERFALAAAVGEFAQALDRL